jgi:hypothetical protein
MKLAIPASLFCYEPHLFDDSIQCPDLGTSPSLDPVCQKFDQPLQWNVYGRVLRCDACLEQAPIHPKGAK